MEGARYLQDSKLTIFKRPGVFYARIRLASQQYLWRTLKTSNEETAIRAGRKLLYQVDSLNVSEHKHCFMDFGGPPLARAAPMMAPLVKFRLAH
jgi:hypothetical protein